MQVEINPTMPDDLVRVPHGWWKPEMEIGHGKLSGAMLHADSLMCRDDPEYMDVEHGVPHLKGIPCRINKITTDALKKEGQTDVAEVH